MRRFEIQLAGALQIRLKRPNPL